MKKTVPLWLGVMCGLYALVEFYIPHHSVGRLTDELRSWASILSAAAFIIGGVNILQGAWPKIRRREPDWPYKGVMLASAAETMVRRFAVTPGRRAVLFTNNDEAYGAAAALKAAADGVTKLPALFCSCAVARAFCAA